MECSKKNLGRSQRIHDNIELTDYRIKSDRSNGNAVSFQEKKMSTPKKAVTDDVDVSDAVRDDKETAVSPRSITMFQEGRSVSVNNKLVT